MSYPYVEAKHHGAVRSNPITMIVLHDMESAEGDNTAESVAQYFHTTDRVASAHYCIDNNSIVQCVKDDVVAYHAIGGNRWGIGLEHAGKASQTREEWLDPYSRAMLTLSVKLSAELCTKYKIPPVFLRAADLKAGNNHGITTHAELSKAFPGSGHTDPGSGFPIDWYIFCLAVAVSPYTAAPPAPPAPPMIAAPVPAPDVVPPTNNVAEVLKALAQLVFYMKVDAQQGKPYKEGDGKANKRDAGVKMIQAAMQKAGQWIAVDGEFGPATKLHVIYWQKHHPGLAEDGIVGSATLNSMYP